MSSKILASKFNDHIRQLEKAVGRKLLDHERAKCIAVMRKHEGKAERPLHGAKPILKRGREQLPTNARQVSSDPFCIDKIQTKWETKYD